MEARAAERARHIPRLSRLLRARDYRAVFNTVTGVVDCHRIIVALEDDPMAYVFDHLHEAGWRGVVALPTGDNTAEIAVVGQATEARVAVAREEDDLVLVNDDATVGMFFTCLRDKHVVVFGRAPKLAARIIDDREMETA